MIEPGAYADMILVDGNPLENIERIHDYKNIIESSEVRKYTDWIRPDDLPYISIKKAKTALEHFLPN